MLNIVNIVNFVRGVEPREGRNIDLKQPIIEQTRIMRENGLKGTFLLQYDALISDDFQALMRDCADFCEIGLWLEIVEPLVKAIGEEWHGRYSWDWYCDVGFLIGYEPDVRLRLIDESMRKFKEIFGKYPDSVGSWHIDAVSMKHLAERYGVSACCICREQVGTDGYTLRGGYFNQAYYPSVNNMLCPASSAENRINMPVFRMLGSDPVYEYDRQVFGYGIDRCATLEPAQLGCDPAWCDWFFEEVFCGRGLCFQYTQTGQENSFGWQQMRDGIEYQFPKVAAMAREGKVKVMTLAETGRWYKQTYPATPATTVAVDRAWMDPARRSVWYNSCRYRINLLLENGIARIRDLYLFDERYPEHYLTKRCDTHACEFCTLPVMDGAIYSNPEKRIVAGIYLAQNGETIHWRQMEYEEISSDVAAVTLTCDAGYARITLSVSEIAVQTDIAGFSLCPVYDRERVFGTVSFGDKLFANHNNRKTNLSFITKAEQSENGIDFTFDGFDYAIRLNTGVVNEEFCIIPEKGSIRISF